MLVPELNDEKLELIDPEYLDKEYIEKIKENRNILAEFLFKNVYQNEEISSTIKFDIFLKKLVTFLDTQKTFLTGNYNKMLSFLFKNKKNHLCCESLSDYLPAFPFCKGDK